MKLILGARGRLGQALSRIWPAEKVMMPPREIYARWWERAAVDEIRSFLTTRGIDGVLVASGITDPAADAQEHEQINFELPRQVLEAAAPLGIHVTTFGSIMEKISGAAAPGPYVLSKRRLADCVAGYASTGAPALHLRIHTLYAGGPPAPFMFTGQMLQALRHREPFRMSPGTQLREYHHVDDDAAAIATLAATDVRGTLDLSHGAALTLAELAQDVFGALNAKSLLRIGALPAPENERTDLRFERTVGLEGHAFRDARQAVPQDLMHYLGAKP